MPFNRIPQIMILTTMVRFIYRIYFEAIGVLNSYEKKKILRKQWCNNNKVIQNLRNLLQKQGAPYHELKTFQKAIYLDPTSNIALNNKSL